MKFILGIAGFFYVCFVSFNFWVGFLAWVDVVF